MKIITFIASRRRFIIFGVTLLPLISGCNDVLPNPKLVRIDNFSPLVDCDGWMLTLEESIVYKKEMKK